MVAHRIKRQVGWIAAGLAASVALGSACGESDADEGGEAVTVDDAGVETDVAVTDTVNEDGGSNQTEPDPSGAELLNPADFDYSVEHVFTLDDVLGGRGGERFADDPSIVCMEGCEDDVFVDGSTTMYPVDNGFGWDAVDFVGATERARDGVHADGWVGAVRDGAGNHIGVAVSNVSTIKYKVGPRMGQWCGGLGGALVKCKSDNFVTMEHVQTCHETIPYLTYDPVTGEPVSSDYGGCPRLSTELDMSPNDLSEYLYDLDGSNMAQGDDYTIYLGEHEGEYKYVWGNWEKRPTDMRLLAHIPLPAEWKEAGNEFAITEAKLAIVHTITNNPNDKILVEDIDTEVASGLEPSYEVTADGRWVSTRDCYEGDGDFIPAGTTLRNPSFADGDRLSEDLNDGFTNAWFTTLDRDPFTRSADDGSPRWRLKAGKFGQDLPGVEIPVEPCTPMPLKKEQVKYPRGELTTTIIDLDAELEPGEGTPLSRSVSFVAPNGEQDIVSGNLTAEGVTLTEDLDLSIFIKGDKKPVRLYKAVLYVNYE